MLIQVFSEAERCEWHFYDWILPSSLYISAFSGCSWRMLKAQFLFDQIITYRFAVFYASNQNDTWIQADIEYPKFKWFFRSLSKGWIGKKGETPLPRFLVSSFPPDLLRYVAQQRALVVLMVWMAQWSQGRRFFMIKGNISSIFAHPAFTPLY